MKEIECKIFGPHQTLSVSSPIFRLNLPPIEVVMKPLTWTPKTELAVIRASLPASLGQEKLHEMQKPQPRADHPQAVADVCRALEVSAPLFTAGSSNMEGCRRSRAEPISY